MKLARQPDYRWLAHQVTEAELTQAYRANALFDAHRDDPEFGYRFLADEAADAGEVMAARTAWRICSTNGWFSVFGNKKRSKAGKPGPPVHEDLVRRDFTAEAPNELWLADLTEHRTLEGKLYLCAIKDVFSGRIVGYSIDSRMKSRIAVNALNNAVARRGDVAGCILHTDRLNPVSFAAESTSGFLPVIRWLVPWAASELRETTPPWRASSASCKRMSLTGESGLPGTTCASRSSLGSRRPITDAAGKTASAD